jgi:hypothetical protein
LTVIDAYDQYFALRWAPATDSTTPRDQLEYRLYYSASANIESVADAQANGAPASDWVKGLTRKAVTAVAPQSSYYFNVLVRNAADLMAAYAMGRVTNGRAPMATPARYTATMAVVGNLAYVGGNSDMVGPPVVGGVILDRSTGLVPSNTLPGGISGRVNAVVADGLGGWYIGGSFPFVHGSKRHNLAHLAGDGVLADWSPVANGEITALAVEGSTAYIGGNFTEVGGQPRNYLAAVDTTTGNVTDWNPNVTISAYAGIGPVTALAISGSTVYVGGMFSEVSAQPRNNLAAVDKTTGVPSSWNPSATIASGAWVKSLLVSGSTVYVGGRFDSIGGQARNNVAAIDAAGGSATSWDPDVDYYVDSMALSGSTLYVGGYFGTIGGQTRTNLGAIDTATGEATSWAPNADAPVQALAVQGSTVYAGGSFATVNGQTRKRIAAIDLATGNPTTWAPSVGRDVRALGVTDSAVFAGGSIVNLNGATRANLAAIDLVSGTVANWNPPTDGMVYTMLATDSTLYAGGSFTRVAGQDRGGFAAFDSRNGVLTNWSPDANVASGNYPELMTTDGSVAYVFGQFTSVGGSTRHGLAAFDLATGTVTPWDPCGTNYCDGVSAMVSLGSLLYLGGRSVQVGSASFGALGAINATTGAVASWRPSVTGGQSSVQSMAALGSSLYVAGDFTAVGGLARNGIAAVDLTGNVTSWNPGATGGWVNSVAVAENTIYIGGSFTTVGGQERHGLASIHASTGATTSWNPDVTGTIRAIAVYGSTLYVAGDFWGIGSKARVGFAVIDAFTGVAL